jgi:predicted DNA-binding protein YlxM (UPF0122 family)
MKMNLVSFLNRELPLDHSWLHISINSLLAGSLLAYIIVFLDPFDTQEYQADYRNVKLAGYALCIILPILISHRLNLLIYNRTGKKWQIKDELISIVPIVLTILTCSYFYNIWVVNEGYFNPSINGFYLFSLNFGLPTLSLIIPLYLFIRHSHIIPKVLHSLRSKVKYIELVGDLSSDRIKLNVEHFFYAKAQGNYVEIYYQEDNEQNKTLIRTTLSSIHEQIPNAIQVHRSFLINPEKVLQLEGNSRKRNVILKGVTNPIPVSHTYAENLKSLENFSPIY